MSTELFYGTTQTYIIYMHAYIHAYMHTYIHTYMHTYRTSHFRRSNFGPSRGGLYRPYVAGLIAKQQTGIASLGRYITAHGPFMARPWQAYSMRHGPILARLVFSNAKACIHTIYTYIHAYAHTYTYIH